MEITIIRTDGTVETVVGEYEDIKRLIGAEFLDSVNLRDGRRMYVDDMGWESRSEEVGPQHFRLVPIRARKPINEKATALYHKVTKPGTAHQIAGDVAIVIEQDD